MTSAVFCTQCGQQNSGDMAFCIFCGAPMTQSVGAVSGKATGFGNPAGADSLAGDFSGGGSGRAAATGSIGQRACASCGQTDPLNGVFCIFCGASVDGPNGSGALPNGTGASARSTPSGGAGIAVPGTAGVSESKKSWLSGAIVPVILAGALGGVLGVGLATWSSQSAEKQPALALPEQGLTILTAQPDSYFKIASKSNKRFIAGKTGADGDVSIEELRPDNYHVSITAPDGKRHEEDIEVTRDNPVVIGGSPGSELFQ